MTTHRDRPCFLITKAILTDDHHGEDSLVDFVRKTLVDTEAGKDSDSDDEEKSGQDESDDPWVEATDEFGRTRVVRKSQLEAINQQFIKAGQGGSGDGEGYDGPALMSEDMRREAERLKWEEEMKNASGGFTI